MVSPCFVNVADDSAGIDLTSLNVGGTYASNDINIQTLTEIGTTDKSYIYTKDRKGNWMWKDVDEGTVISEGDVMFKTGTGLWVAGVDDATITAAGAVSKSDVVIPLVDGFVATGNMSPVAVDLTSIIPGGTYASNDINIQTLTEIGTTDKSYIFTKDRKGNWMWKDVDEGTTIAEGDVIFEAGKGLWVGGVEGATITIPAPIF